MAKIEEVGDLADLRKDNTVKAASEKRFDSVLKEAVKEADQAIKDTWIMNMKLASGQIDNLHTMLMQAEETAVAVEFTTQTTTKVVNAYDQIMGMQV